MNCILCELPLIGEEEVSCVECNEFVNGWKKRLVVEKIKRNAAIIEAQVR